MQLAMKTFLLALTILAISGCGASSPEAAPAEASAQRGSTDAQGIQTLSNGTEEGTKVVRDDGLK